ncbi:MAG: type II toxin-antitoxin system YafQ family toxin [Bacteroidaceae bacterium]|nr:type II toxin-antitoxin system YafQ family toxin [Bacteroidaceae bacterium]
MKYELELTHQYLKDLKLARKRGLDESKLNEIIIKLISDEILPPKNKDYSLTGNYKGFRECHIQPDWLLIYSRDVTIKIITLVRTGTHSDLF